MRKLVSAQERSALKNIVANEDGTIVQAGGNWAYESIEQNGVLVDGKEEITFGSPNTIGIIATDFVGTATALNSVTSITSSQSKPSISGMSDLQNGEVYAHVVSGKIVWKINDTYYVAERTGAGSLSIKFVDLKVNATGKSMGTDYKPAGKVFVPFMQTLRNGEWNIENHLPTIELPPVGFVAIVLDTKDDYTGIFMSDGVAWVTLGER